MVTWNQGKSEADLLLTHRHRKLLYIGEGAIFQIHYELHIVVEQVQTLFDFGVLRIDKLVEDSSTAVVHAYEPALFQGPTDWCSLPPCPSSPKSHPIPTLTSSLEHFIICLENDKSGGNLRN